MSQSDNPTWGKKANGTKDAGLHLRIPSPSDITNKVDSVLVKYKPPSSIFFRRFVFGLSGVFCKLFILLCRVRLYNYDSYMRMVDHRPRGTPLITAANHSSCLDDPLLFAFLPWRIVLNPFRMRWSLGAREICFSNEATGWFFGNGHVIPIVRGAGIYQEGMAHALKQLSQGGWIHIFPEAKVNQLVTLERFKWGVGRLVMESPVPPIILPFWHRGMERILPEPDYPQDTIDIDDRYRGLHTPASSASSYLSPKSVSDNHSSAGSTGLDATVPLAAGPVSETMDHQLRGAPTPKQTVDLLSPPELRAPRPFQSLVVAFGEPIDTATILEDLRSKNLDDTQIRIEITKVVQNAVRKVKMDAIAQIRVEKQQESEQWSKFYWWQKVWYYVKPFFTTWSGLSIPLKKQE